MIDLKNLKKNKIYKLLIKNKLIKNKNLSVFHTRTRDNKNLKSFIDNVTNIIFLEKIKRAQYYKNKKTRKIDEKYTKTHYGKFRISVLQDTQRRLNQFRSFVKNKVILEFGCGSGEFLYRSQKILKKGIGIDSGFERIEYSDNKKINFFKDISQINNLDFKFDSIFLFHVFEHLVNPIEILTQLRSKLKKNGNLIIEVPHANNFLLRKLKIDSFMNFTLWSEHLILHTKKSLKCFLEKSGFKKNRIFFYQRYNLNNNIGWLLYDKPRGHIFFKKLFGKKAIEQYNNILIKNGHTDTIFSISKN